MPFLSENDTPGNTLFVQHVDNLARIQPRKPFVSFPKTNTLSDGFRDITWGVFGNAVSRAAHWMETLPSKRCDFETLAYFGDSDIRYFILVLAANKTGYKLLLPSPRNSEEGQLNLLEKTDCCKLLRSEGVSVQNILQARPSLQCFLVPTLDELLDETPVPHYPYKKSFSEGQADPHVVFHTSGSTGLPKPIISPEGAVCTVDVSTTIPDLRGKPYSYSYLAERCPRFFCNLPLFHAAGFILGLHYPAFFGNVAVVGPAGRPLSASLLDEMIKYGDVQGLYGPPAILEEATKIPAFLDNLSKLELIICATGPLSTYAGAAVAEKTHLSLCSGSTESYLMPTHIADREDWRYLMINTQAGGIDWRKEPDRDLYELVYINEPKKKHVHAAFQTFPDRQEFGTGDLFEKHPTKPDLWRLVGRRDDMLVLSTGEKVQPRPMEDMICGHSAVRSAIVFGHGRFQTGAVIELREYPSSAPERSDQMDSVWEYVEKANGQAPAHARLVRELVFFAGPEKPFVRVGKGSISRPASIQLYQPEIDRIYANAESSVAVDLELIDPFDHRSFLHQIRAACEKAMRIRLDTDTQDFFAAGADSIGALVLASTIKRALQSCTAEQRELVNTRLIYENSSISRLSSALRDLVSNATLTSLSDPNQELSNMVHECLTQVSWGQPKAVVLTGSTGSLGSYLLNSLLEDPKIDIVYCFNRQKNARGKQMASNASRGLSTNFVKAVFLEVDLSREDLGVPTEVYETMLTNVKHIIHSAWPVNFNTSSAAFRPHVLGVANLASFAMRTTSNAPICFLSSVATVQKWSHCHSKTLRVPEKPHNDARLTDTGYGLSKLAASMILERAAAKGVRSIVIRVGQMAGPVRRGTKGSWPKHEWLPSIITSSKYLGVLPDSLGSADHVDWIPVDLAADMIWEMAKSAAARPANKESPDNNCRYLHLTNPHVTTWQESVLPSLQKHFGESVRTVPLKEWIATLKQSTNHCVESSHALKNPAMKLMTTYESFLNDYETGHSFPHLCTEQAQSMSSGMEQLRSVNADWVRQWLEQWAC